MFVVRVKCKERREGDARCQELTRCLGGGRRGLDIPSLRVARHLLPPFTTRFGPPGSISSSSPQDLDASRANAPQRQPGLAEPTVRQAEFALDEMVLPSKDPEVPPTNPETGMSTHDPAHQLRDETQTLHLPGPGPQAPFNYVRIGTSDRTHPGSGRGSLELKSRTSCLAVCPERRSEGRGRVGMRIPAKEARQRRCQAQTGDAGRRRQDQMARLEEQGRGWEKRDNVGGRQGGYGMNHGPSACEGVPRKTNDDFVMFLGVLRPSGSFLLVFLLKASRLRLVRRSRRCSRSSIRSSNGKR